MRDAGAQPSHEQGAINEGGFWAIFAAAWLVYASLYVIVGVFAEGRALGWALMLAFMNAGPPALVSLPVALRRRDLLRPEWTLGRTVLVHVGVGILYAVTTAILITSIVTAFGVQEAGLEEAGKVVTVAYMTVAAGFLYTVLAGFLMWSESLRRVHESRNLAAREAVLRAQAEAKALRAQFNPHFVFNTLHSLMLLVRADPAAAERAIEDVATLIRYASILQRHEIDEVPLTKELEVARRYLALEQLRLEDRLHVTWSVEVEPGEVVIPSFALQTLVENAIKHGLEPRPEGGTVQIAVTAQEGVLQVVVSDDGQGALPARVNEAEGHGLQLLQQRLSTLYGDAASLSWETQMGEGFRVTLRVPATAPGSVPELDVIHVAAADR